MSGGSLVKRLAVAALASGALLCMAGLTSASASPSDTRLFVYTGTVQTWAIPSGATQLVVSSFGASGTAGTYSSSLCRRYSGGPCPGAAPGGQGAEISTTIAVGSGTSFRPGDTLQIWAGAEGGVAQLDDFAGGVGATDGYGDGGHGGQGGGGSAVFDESANDGKGRWINVAGGGGGGSGGGGGYAGGLWGARFNPCAAVILTRTSGGDAYNNSDGGGGGGGCRGGSGGPSEDRPSWGGGFFSTTHPVFGSAPPGDGCVKVTWTSGPPPPVDLPEVPYALGLPILGLGALGGLVWYRRRRMTVPV